ncbi:MAG: hypothetical protein QGG39_11885, partial [Candidatus Poribacteria bacterium]|nr:hypothetical protein [Candidatus Poribacteria bacterium]
SPPPWETGPGRALMQTSLSRPKCSSDPSHVIPRGSPSCFQRSSVLSHQAAHSTIGSRSSGFSKFSMLRNRSLGVIDVSPSFVQFLNGFLTQGQQPAITIPYCRLKNQSWQYPRKFQVRFAEASHNPARG